MNRTALLAATALSTVAWSTAALADGGNGKKLTGLGDFGYEYTDVEFESGFGYYANTFHGAGSALWTWPQHLNLQGNFAFNTDRLEFDGGEWDSVDSWRGGLTGFWRDPNQGALGGEIHYQSTSDLGQYGDGIDIAARGEFYLPQATIGGRVAYTKLTGNHTNSGQDGWDVGLEGKYYATPNIGLKLGATASWYDFEPASAGTADRWALDGEVEYLIPDCTTSIYAGLGYQDGEFDSIGTSEFDGWRAGLGLRVHFGTEGGLLQRNRAEPLEVSRLRMIF
jgi:hypothetical protein